jgi:hypothetical protein
MLGGSTYTFFQVVDIRLEKHEVGGKVVRPKRVHDVDPGLEDALGSGDSSYVLEAELVGGHEVGEEGGRNVGYRSRERPSRWESLCNDVRRKLCHHVLFHPVLD